MLADRLSEYFTVGLEEWWERERTATPVKAFDVRLHATDCSLRDSNDSRVSRRRTVARSRLEGMHQDADSVPDPPSTQPSRVAVDETAVKINGERSWLYAAIGTDTKVILDVAVFGRHGPGPAAAFPSRSAEKHDLSDAVFLVDQFGYLTALARVGSSGRIDYTDRNLIERWSQTLTVRIVPFTTRGWAVGGARTVGVRCLRTTTTVSDPTSRSTVERLPKRC